jgi:hypothetical protein
MAKRTVETGQRYRDVQPGIGAAPAASADEEEWPEIDTPGTEPSYLRAERDDAWSLAVSWRGALVAALLFGCLALLAAYFH